MLDLLDTTTAAPAAANCLQRALEFYAIGDNAGLEQTAILAVRIAEQTRDHAAEACALILVAASGHWNGRYQIERAERRLWAAGGSSINRAIVAFALAWDDDRLNQRARALAGYQSALEHIEQAKRTAAWCGDMRAYRRAQAVERRVYEWNKKQRD
jgi:hypothetical protein